LTTLSIGKSGLRSYAHCLHDELKDQGVYVGMLSIAGVIEEGTHFSPGNIADEYFDMYERRDVAERFYVDESEDAAGVLTDADPSGRGARTTGKRTHEEPGDNLRTSSPVATLTCATLIVTARSRGSNRQPRWRPGPFFRPSWSASVGSHTAGDDQQGAEHD